MSDELKLCPFCGNVPELGEHNVDQSSWKPRYDVACRNDKCILQRTYETQAVAVAAWNTRPIEDELLEKLQQLQAKVAYLESALVDTENDKDRALSAFNELDSKWDAIPWEAIEIGRAVLAWGFRQVRHDELAALTKFIDANAPEEEGE